MRGKPQSQGHCDFSTMAKPKTPPNYKRIDDVPCAKFKALSVNELRMLAPIKMAGGHVGVNRGLLSRLLQERERLVFAAEAGRWLLETCIAKGVLANQDFETADDQERAAGLMVAAMEALDLDFPDGVASAPARASASVGIGS